MACRTCFAGAWKVLCRRFGEGSTAALEEVDGATAVWHQDEAELLAQVQQAFPHLLKFNTKGREEPSLSAIGLLHLCSRMMMDISEADVNRLFAECDKDCDGGLNMEELFEASKKIDFFRNLLSVILAAAEFRVGKDYDYSKSTIQNYMVCKGGDAAAGALKDVDSADILHERRVRWQESILQRWLPKRSPQKGPWLIIGLALPQALPEQVLAWLFNRNILPIGDFVEVSVDLFSQLMPELPLYIDRHGSFREGRCFVRQEAELLERRALEAVMDAQQNVWMPCLPGEAHHAVSLLQGLHRKMDYKIAVFDFRMDSTVMSKRRKALRKTGRMLPVSAGPQIPSQEDIESLESFANVSARIQCDEEIPVLLRVQFANASGCWPVLHNSFLPKQVEGTRAGMFPNALRPLHFQRVKGGNLLVGEADLDHLVIDVLHFGAETGCLQSARKLVAAIPILQAPVKLKLSPVGKQLQLPGVSVQEENQAPTRSKEDEITSFAWLHGLSTAGFFVSSQFLQDLEVATSSPVVAILTGCLVHFTKKGKLAFIDIPMGQPLESSQKSKHSLQFGTARSMSARVTTELGQRWQPVSEEGLCKGGAELECWLHPGEVVDGRTLAGGFAYKLLPQVAAQVGSRSIYFEVLYK